MHSEWPMVHRLFVDCVALVKSYLDLILQDHAIPQSASNLKNIDFSDTTIYLSLKHSNFGEAVNESMTHLSIESKKDMQREFRAAVVAQCKYLIQTMPLENEFLASLRFLQPKFIDNPMYVRSIQKVARETK